MSISVWSRLGTVTVCVIVGCLMLVSGASADKGDTGSLIAKSEGKPSMQVYYLEIVTPDVDGVCASLAAGNGGEFSDPVAVLGNARTMAMSGGGWVGVRAPLRDTEDPIIRPYWLVEDIKSALAAAEKAGGRVAHPPLEIPGYGTFAIYIQGGANHGLWQK